MKNMLNALIPFGPTVLTSFGVRVGLFVSLFLLEIPGSCQNLVQNWSFEDTAFCSTPVSSPIRKAHFWFSANTATPDVYSVLLEAPCGIAMDPDDFLGEFCYQAPFQGLRFAGEYLWKQGGQLKEYMEVGLTAPLQAGHSYRVAMEVSFPECYEFALDRFGAYFSVDTVFDPSGPVPGVLGVNPHAVFYDPLFFANRTDWMHVEDTIVASGGERFMVIGSFTDNASTSVLSLGASGPTNGGYYYFDAIEVEEILAQSVGTVTIRLSATAGGYLSITWPGVERIDEIRIHDLSGKLIGVVGPSICGIDSPVLVGINMEAGTYVVTATSERQRANAKLIVLE